MTAQELEQEIQQTRAHLGETIDELAGKADVKTRVRTRAADVSDRVRQSRVLQRRWPLAVAAGVLIAGSVLIRRRRKQA